MSQKKSQEENRFKSLFDIVNTLNKVSEKEKKMKKLNQILPKNLGPHLETPYGFWRCNRKREYLFKYSNKQLFRRD
jgi:hypothetical protein